MDADLVLEGGGVKGSGLVGAVTVLQDHGYEFPRVAGTSAGAIVGSLVAAGLGPVELDRALEEVDYLSFLDRRLVGKVPVAGGLFALLRHNGIYAGRHVVDWLAELLSGAGVEVFGDLRIDDPDADLPYDRRYKLVVMAADLTTGRLVRLPWDYRRLYGKDPDRQRVVDAVRASMAIPLFFEPVRLGGSVLVDGGIVSNYPVDAFDRTDGLPPRWPTFGIRLFARPEANQELLPAVAVTTLRRLLGVPEIGAQRIGTVLSCLLRSMAGPVGLTAMTVAAMINAHDQMQIDDPAVQARSMLVDTSEVSPVDFALEPERRRLLADNGRQAAELFLKDWDFARYLETFRGLPVSG